MTGTWEQRLQRLARGADWAMPAADALRSAITSITPKLTSSASEPGITGKSGDAASESFRALVAFAAQLNSSLDLTTGAISAANTTLAQARKALAALPPGDTGSALAAVIGSTAPGTKILLGAFSVIASPLATGAANLWLSGQREAAAQQAVKTATEELDAHPALPALPDPSVSFEGLNPGPTPPVSPSYPLYPNHHDTPMSLVPLHPSIIDHTPQTGDGTWTGAPGVTAGVGSALFGSGYIAPVLTADGPIASGLATLSGAPRGGLLGGLSGGAALTGSASFSGPTGLAAGIGGAAALGAGSLISKSGLGGLGGGGLGGSGIGGSRIGGSGLGGASGGRVAGGGSGLAGAGASSRGSGSGILGSQGAAEGRGASAGASESGRAGGRGAPGMMGGGGHGGGGADKKTASTGLGGLIAPKLDDDAELGPRSAAAGAGGRD